jgi:hypothetical protein
MVDEIDAISFETGLILRVDGMICASVFVPVSQRR